MLIKKSIYKMLLDDIYGYFVLEPKLFSENYIDSRKNDLFLFIKQFYIEDQNYIQLVKLSQFLNITKNIIVYSSLDDASLKSIMKKI